MCYGNCLPLALLVFASKLPPPLRPPYVSELHTPPSPATADRSLALGPFEEQPHQLFGVPKSVVRNVPSYRLGNVPNYILWNGLFYIIQPPAHGSSAGQPITY